MQSVQHELHISNQVMHLRPPTEVARCRLLEQLHEWVSTITGLPRIQSSRYQVCVRLINREWVEPVGLYKDGRLVGKG